MYKTPTRRVWKVERKGQPTRGLESPGQQSAKFPGFSFCLMSPIQGVGEDSNAKTTTGTVQKAPRKGGSLYLKDQERDNLARLKRFQQ